MIKNISVFAFLLSFIRKSLRIYIALFICIIFVSSAGALYPYFFKQLINQMSSPNPFDMRLLSHYALLIILVWGASELLSNLQDFIVIHAFPKLKVAIRQFLLESVIQKPIQFFSTEMTGGIGERMANVPNCCLNIMSIGIFNFFSTFITLASSFFLMFSVNSQYIEITLLWAIAHLTIAYFYKDRLNNLCETHAKTRADLSGTIFDILTNLINIHAFCSWIYESHYFRKIQKKDERQEQKTMAAFLQMKFLQSLAIVSLFAWTILHLLSAWESKHINLGQLTMIIMLTINIISSIRSISTTINSFILDSSNVREALRFLAVDTKTIKKPNAINQSNEIKAAPPLTKICFKNVYFSYEVKNPSHWVLENFSMTIEPGKHIGLVGLSGAGKSTLLKLLLGFYKPTRGQIFINDEDIANIPTETLRAMICWVPQDPLLFHRSVNENIRYSNQSASEQEIISATQLAHCLDFIENTSERFQTIISDRGGNFSRGQLQRIALARGILKNSPLILLDEPTASVDLLNENLIQASIEKLITNRTAIVVAHRLETLIHMNELLVMDKGKIVERGNFHDLINAKGLFATLWESRQKYLDYE